MGGKGALTHDEPCVRSLQPETGQIQVGARCRHQKLSITCSSVVGGGLVDLGVDIETLHVVLEGLVGDRAPRPC